MKLFIVFCLNLLPFIQTNAQSKPGEEKLVLIAFDNYKKAILTDDAPQALSNVDSRTKKYYAQILNEVKNADSIKISSMSIIDKITILSIRAKASKQEILSMQGAELFIYAIKNGMVGKNSVVNNTVGKVTIDNTFATGQLLVNGKETPLFFHFYKEENKWLLDITSLFETSSAVFKAMIAESGESENDYLFSILEVLNGKKPNSEIWNPIN